MSKPIFITGIGTDVGKTIISAVVVEKLRADYWKPIQAGDLHHTDTMKVQQMVSNPQSVFHPEAYRLTQPYSPHKAAALDGVEIDLDNIIAPQTTNQLVIEGAGGLMVPLNSEYLVIDLIKKLNAEVVLVSRNYLGSINHTLLSAAALKQWDIPVKGIIFNGDADEASESYITAYTGLPVIGRVPMLADTSAQNISKTTQQIKL